MPRSSVQVRCATRSDAVALSELWAQLRVHSGRTAQHTPVPSIDRVVHALDFTEQDPTARLFVAEMDDEVVGMVSAVPGPLSPFVDVPVLQVDYLQVRQGFERRGVGRSLIAAAAAYADEIGSEHVLVNVFPAARNAHRFYARLGFSPVVTRRLAHVSVLRRRLGLDTVSSVHEGRAARRRAVLSGRRALVSNLRRG